jgi:hypothetical protein
MKIEKSMRKREKERNFEGNVNENEVGRLKNS